MKPPRSIGRSGGGSGIRLVNKSTPSNNLDPMVAQVLQSGQATLIELRTIYSMEDMYNLWEVVKTKEYNLWVANEREIQSARLRRQVKGR